ncbi:hypothetical protein [Ralstonia chuxiongensis]|uniref:hypothetical protein n=1 Tax=Ralstonia chuxiongensis TaxID=2957504 RepID=UPI0028F57A97|nr:hypothetical protein [Ralstonia chuxiongensis]CAJ0770189.1 hypothetical protein R8510_00348 [Ralstonia chuxiongensis]
MRILNRLAREFLCIVFVLAVFFFAFAAYSEYENTPCGMSRAAKSRLLEILTPAEALTLESLQSAALPECPDVFRFQYKGRELELTAADVVIMGEPRSPK